jgi:TetR/AcrR family transcriptional regulator, transcriptional repressor for nem operon
MSCFWGRGYESTSVRELATAMGVGGPSLYNAFGDKRALFAVALEHYCRSRTYPLIARIEREHTGPAAIPAFFNEIIERSVADRERRGCFLINSALDVAPHDKELAAAVALHLDAIRAFLRRQLQSARSGGELSAGLAPDAVAGHLLAVLLGIRVLARTQPDRALLARTAAAALQSIGYSNAVLRKSGLIASTKSLSKRAAARG